MRRGIGWGLCLAGAFAGVIALLVLALGRLDSVANPTINLVANQSAGTLILDAGHGGEDGGAVSVSGIPESQINLAIVLKMRDILGIYGVDPILLRETDRSLHDGSASTLREKKSSDLRNRVDIVQSVQDATLLSIHQNTYTDQRYRGAQAFYAPTRGSQELAEYFQACIQSALQPDNERLAKQIPDTVYLMNHVDCPAILVECGFLTNPEEEALLQDHTYQTQLAMVLSGAWLTRK